MIFKKIRFFFYFLLAIPGLVLLGLSAYAVVSGKYFIFKALYYNLTNIDDYKIFPTRTITKSSSPKEWPLSVHYNAYTLPDDLRNTLAQYGTTAFLIIRHDSIQHESYYDTGSPEGKSLAFSMSKSVVAMLIGVALKEGHIRSLDQPVADFLPEFSDKPAITIKHLLWMSSGLDWDESRSYKNLVQVFLSDIMEAYYGDDLYTLVTSKGMAGAPGTAFSYSSADTQLLALILQKATGKSLSAYFEEKIWKPMGAAADATWNLDRPDGVEKAYCCLASNAREYAKLGSILLHKGWANGAQILDTTFVEAATRPSGLADADDPKLKNFYGYQIWLKSNEEVGEEGVYYFRGTLGQFVIVVPSHHLIIVRLGTNQGPKEGAHYAQSLAITRQVLAMYRDSGQ